MSLEPHLHKADELIDPDPLTLLLTILSGAGSVASLYALYDTRMLAKRAERQANRNAVKDALMGAETALNDLAAHTRSLEIAFEVGRPSRAPIEGDALVAFGRVQLLFTADGYLTWREIQEGILTAVGRLQRHIADILRIFATSDIRLPEASGRAVQGLTNELNAMLRSMHQMSYLNFFRELETIIANAQTVIRQIRFDAYEALR